MSNIGSEYDFPLLFFVLASKLYVITGYLWSFLFRYILDSDDLFVILLFFGFPKCLFSSFSKMYSIEFLNGIPK